MKASLLGVVINLVCVVILVWICKNHQIELFGVEFGDEAVDRFGFILCNFGNVERVFDLIVMDKDSMMLAEAPKPPYDLPDYGDPHWNIQQMDIAVIVILDILSIFATIIPS